MAQEYSEEVKEQAFDLYVMGGFTFEEVARTTGVSVSQLKRWSADDKKFAERRGETGQDWPEARKEYRLAKRVVPRKSALLRALLIDKALGSGGDFKRVLAAAMWEKTQAGKDLQIGNTAKGEPPGGSTCSELPGEFPVIKTAQDAVAALDELINRKIYLMANNPDLLTFQTAKEVKQTLALIEELKAKYRPDEKTSQALGLSDEAAEEIRRQFLGAG